MKKNRFYKIMASLLILGMFTAYVTPFNTVIKVNAANYDFVDSFSANNLADNWQTSLVSGKTGGSYTAASRIDDGSGSNYVMKPSVYSTAGTYITRPADSKWEGGKPKSFTFKFLGSSYSTGNPIIPIYYDAATGGYAGFSLGTASSTVNGVTQTVVAGYLNRDDTYVDLYYNTTHSGANGYALLNLSPASLITVNITYSYSGWDSATKDICAVIKLTGVNAFDGTTTTVTYQDQSIAGWHFRIRSGDIPSSNIFCGFMNTTTANFNIDDVTITNDMSVAKTSADSFKSTYADIFSRDVSSFTMNDSTRVGEALSTYNSFDATTQALVVTEATKLNQIIAKLKSDIPVFSSDNFENGFLTNNYWETIKLSADPTKAYTISKDGTNNVLSLPVNTTMASSVIDIKDSYLPIGKPKKVSFKFKNNSNVGGWSTKLIPYFDPATKSYASLELAQESPVAGEPSYLAVRAAYTTGMVMSPNGSGAKLFGKAAVTTSLCDAQRVPFDQWITVEASYDYSQWSSKKLIITYNFKAQDGSLLRTNTYTYTLATGASDKVKIAFSNTVSSGTIIDDVTISEMYVTAQDKANNFKNVNATILAKDPAQTLTADELQKLNNAIEDFFLLSSDAQTILTSDGTKAKLEALIAPIAATDTAANAFKTKYKSLLDLTTSEVKPAVQALLDAALAEFETLLPISKMILSSEKAKLDLFTEILINYIEPRTDDDMSPFTENFEGNLKNWQTVNCKTTTASDFSIVPDPVNPSNNVLYYKANGAFLMPKSAVWPAYGTMTKLTFKMYCSNVGGNAQAKNTVFASFVDADNWNGMQWGVSKGTDSYGKLISMEIALKDGDAVSGSWSAGTDFNPTGWFDVSITYKGNKATITLADEKGNTMSQTIAVNYLNGRLAFGRPTDQYGTMYPIYIDNINAEFKAADWDNNITVNDIKTYYTGNTFIKPDDVALITGENIGNTVKEAYIMQLPATVHPSDVSYISRENYRHIASSGAVTATWDQNAATKVSLVQTTPGSIKFVVPGSYTSGIYVVRLVAKNEGSSDVYVYLNNPEINFTLGDEGEVTTPGGKIRIIGNNLVPTGNINDLTVAIKDSTGKITFIPVTEIKPDDMYSIEAQMPLGTPYGTYQIFVHSGYGNSTAWSSPKTITVGPAPKESWPKTVFNVKDYGAKADGKVNDTPAIVSALTAAFENGGGIVYLPRGIYRIVTTLVIPENVEFKGDGLDDTMLFWDATRWQYGKVPKAILSITNNVEIHDMGFHGTRAKDFLDKNFKGVNQNIYLHDIRVQFYPYMGGPTGGGGSSTGEMSTTDMYNAVTDEMRGMVYWNFATGGNSRTPVTNVKFKNILFNTGIGFLYDARHIDGTFRYWSIKNMNFKYMWAPIVSQAAGILEDCDYTSATNGLTGNFYMARTYMHNTMINNRELYTSDGLMWIDGAVVQFIGPLADKMPDGVTDQVTFKFADSTKSSPGALVGQQIYVESGQGMGQVRTIVWNDTYTFKVDEPFVIPPNRNSLVAIHAVRAGSYFINDTFEDGQQSGTYGTLIDSVFDGNKFIRHGGQVINVHNGLVWYVSTVNGQLIKPFFMHGDGVTTVSKVSIGHWQLGFIFGQRPYSSMAFLFKNNKTYDGGYLDISWFNKGSNGTRDLIIEDNLFDTGADYGITSSLSSSTSQVADGVLLKGNTYNTTENYTADLKAVANSSTLLNKTNSPRFVDLDLINVAQNVKGDVNGDGVVSLKDSTMIRNYLQEKITLTASQLTLADINSDGIVDLKDSTYIRKLLVS